jgi:hydrogenase nickel incorporation protein HypA/HybF
MHEFSLVEQILSRALELSGENGGLPIEEVVVEIGTLQQVVPEALLFAFEAARAETPAAEAKLTWTSIPARIMCPACSGEYETSDVIWACPDCHTPGGRVVQGDDLILKRVVLKDSS